MTKLFYFLGKKVGKSWARGKYLYTTLTGNDVESVKAEYNLGLILSKDIERQYSVLDAPYEQLLLETILKPLQSRVKRKERYFTVKIIASADMNAFALPGGFLYITSALVKALSDDRDALAFVLAHEMIHVILKHPLKQILTSYSLDALSRMFKAGSTVGIYGKDLIKKVIKSHYSQDRELQADEYAVRLIYSAGFDPQGAIRLLQFFQKSKGENEGFNYFATHPPVSERGQQLRRIIKGGK